MGYFIDTVIARPTPAHFISFGVVACVEAVLVLALASQNLDWYGFTAFILPLDIDVSLFTPVKEGLAVRINLCWSGLMHAIVVCFAIVLKWELAHARFAKKNSVTKYLILDLLLLKCSHTHSTVRGSS